MILRIAITLLCGVGLYAALFMLNKARKAARGQLAEPSVVQTPRARLLGFNNAWAGAAFYPILAILAWVSAAAAEPVWRWLAMAISLPAAAMSLVLAYSLLRVTKMPCPYCWTAHVTNWLLAVLCIALVVRG